MGEGGGFLLMATPRTTTEFMSDQSLSIMAHLHDVVCISQGGLFYSLPLRGRGRSSCPVKASYGSGAEQ